jgi:hypothetical protein
MDDYQHRKRFILTGLQSWDEWKTRLYGYLCKKKACGVVSGAEPCPEPQDDEDYGNNSDAIEDWEDRDSAALAAIIDSVDSKNLSLIRLARTSKTAYATLARKHESKSIANVSAKMRQLISLVQTSDLPSFTQEIEVLREQIAAGLAALKDASLLDILAVTVMMRGAHPDFGATIAAINQQDEMDFDSCRADMDSEAERLRYDGRGIITKSIGRQPRERAKPTPVTDDHDADPFGEKKSGPPCAHCGKPGHHIKQCFSLHPELVPKRKDKTGEKWTEKRSERPEHAKIASNAPPEDYAMA